MASSGRSRPMTAPTGRHLAPALPFYSNDLSTKITGDSAGRYTYDRAACAKPHRPTTAVVRGTLPERHSKAPTRPSTAVLRRRYFFPQSVSMKNSSAKENPFYSHFDVTIRPQDDQNTDPTQQSALNYKAGIRKNQSFYYRDFSQQQYEHFVANREQSPLQVDVQQLRDWLVTATPRTAMDAGPLLSLCQNIMKSLLEDKSIVIERRAEEEAEKQVGKMAEMERKLAAVEEKLAASEKENQMLSNNLGTYKSKYLESADKVHKLQKQLEHAAELVRLREDRIVGIDAEIGNITLESNERQQEADHLRKHLGGVLDAIGPTLQWLQSGAAVASSMEAMTVPKKVVEELWDEKTKFQVPESPSVDMHPTKLFDRIQALHQVSQLMTDQLLTHSSDAWVLSEAGKPLERQLVAVRDHIVTHRMEVLQLASGPEPKNVCVLRAVLKLIGHPPKKSHRWTDIRRAISPQLVKSLLQIERGSEKAVTNLKEAAGEIENVNLKTVKEESGGLGVLYAFVHAHVAVHEAKVEAAAKAAADKAAAAAAAKAAAAEEDQ